MSALALHPTPNPSPSRGGELVRSKSKPMNERTIVCFPRDDVESGRAAALLNAWSDPAPGEPLTPSRSGGFARARTQQFIRRNEAYEHLSQRPQAFDRAFRFAASAPTPNPSPEGGISGPSHAGATSPNLVRIPSSRRRPRSSLGLWIAQTPKLGRIPAGAGMT